MDWNWLESVEGRIEQKNGIWLGFIWLWMEVLSGRNKKNSGLLIAIELVFEIQYL